MKNAVDVPEGNLPSSHAATSGAGPPAITDDNW
jgi:hypothetical protein